MTQRLNGKIALVVGAGSSHEGLGNGKATAVLFARHGAKVIAADRDIAAARVTRDLIHAEGGDCEIVEADVAVSAQVEAMVSASLAAFGRIDILHNNVGIIESGGPVEMSEENWNRVLSVNLGSVFRTCKHVLPLMEKQGSGSIVNVASVLAFRYLGIPNAAYAASKAGIVALTQQIALQYASRGIRANCVLPGLMDTPMIHDPMADAETDAAMVSRRNRKCPTGRMGDAWDTAYAALFLASDEARYITAQSLVVDGGLTAASG